MGAAVVFSGCQAASIEEIREEIRREVRADAGSADDSAAPGVAPGVALIEGVPFFPTDELMCGPATLASVLNYHGHPVSLEALTDALYRPELGGALSMDMLIYAKKTGLDAKYYKSSMEDMKALVMAGTPPILFLNMAPRSLPVGHYVVVVGFSDARESAVIHSGREGGKVVGYRWLRKRWEKTGRSVLLVRPDGDGGDEGGR